MVQCYWYTILSKCVAVGKEQVVPTGSPISNSSAMENKKHSPPDYIKQLELFSGNDIFASKEE